MTYGTAIMFCVAAVLGIVAIVMFLRLARPHSERAGYGYMMAATMLAAASVMLGAYATALWTWSRSP
jgi:hypothetical protein